MTMQTIQQTEGKRQLEQARLDLAMGTAWRNQTGQFSTPNAQADEIMRYCVDRWVPTRRPGRFLEPCVGTGSFYSSLQHVFPAKLIESAFACELNDGHAEVARMHVNYGSAVKEYLIRRVRLLHIHRFCPTDVQFDDALVSSAIAVFQKSPRDDQEVTFSLGGSLRAPAKSVARRQGELVPMEKWTKYMDASPGHSHERRHSLTFGDLFTIKRGLATGNNSFFILTREKAAALGIPAQFLRPILPSPRCIADPVIEADEAGFARLSPQLVLIDCRLSEETVARQFARFWDYLQLGKGKGVHNTYLTSRRTPWYSQEERRAAAALHLHGAVQPRPQTLSLHLEQIQGDGTQRLPPALSQRPPATCA